MSSNYYGPASRPRTFNQIQFSDHTGEIFGLKWGAVKGDHCEVRMRVYRGEVDTPKTDHSVRNVAFGTSLVADLEEWRSRCADTTDGVFPSENGRTAVWRDTLWRRHVLPRLKEVGLGWVNFQVMRRTHSSLMHDLDVDPKLVADQLGHTLDVNQNVYTKAALRRRQSAVQKLEEALQKSLLEPNGAKDKEEEG
jgi:integrase